MFSEKWVQVNRFSFFCHNYLGNFQSSGIFLFFLAAVGCSDYVECFLRLISTNINNKLNILSPCLHISLWCWIESSFSRWRPAFYSMTFKYKKPCIVGENFLFQLANEGSGVECNSGTYVDMLPPGLSIETWANTKRIGKCMLFFCSATSLQNSKTVVVGW